MLQNIFEKYNIESISNDLISGIIGKHELDLIINELPKDIVVISILDTDNSFDINNKEYSSDIQNKFIDFKTFYFLDIEEDNSVGKYTCLSFEIAQEIRSFIEKNKGNTFLIQCIKGKNRSAGVAKAIECISMFDGDVNKYQDYVSDIDLHSRYKEYSKTVFNRILNIKEVKND